MPSYLGGYTNTETKLDFTGQPQESITYHKRDSNSSVLTTTELFTYTPQGRLLTHTHQVLDFPVEVLVHNTYDALGQLVTKQVGGDETYVQNIGHLQTVDYQYNIRGWLKQINDVEDLTTTNDLFAFKINYDTPEVYGTTPLYNGNISETIWKTSSDNIHRGYGYEYDKLNRLTNAYFGTNHQINNHFNEHLSYDKNGNITTLQRTGNVDGFDQIIDDLSYEYIGNQLKSVTDADHGNQYFGFVDGNQQGEDYHYDMFGNMTQDLNKHITEIKYNHLNLPVRIRFANGGEINYLYDAMGVKVRKFVHEQGYNVSVTDYLNGFQYSNEVLQFFPHIEGYVQFYREGLENGNTNQGNNGAPLQEGYSYVYQFKDHLGNNRLNFTLNREGTLSILSEDHYYPFGMKHPYNNDKRDWTLIRIENIPTPFVLQVPNSGYQYKFNGKEWQDELGLNFYDYGARNYDPTIGRWMNVDPLAEANRRWTPYRYGYNNPLVFIDPDGMLETDFGVNDKGEVKQIGPTNKEPDKLFKLNDDGSKNNNIKPLVVKDKTILPQLTKKNPDLVQKHHTDKKEVLTGRSATTTNAKESLNIFKFMSENTNVEWALQGNNNKSSINWILGTLHSNDQVPTFDHMKGFERNSIAFHYHAHTGLSWDDFKPSANDINFYRKTLEVSPNAQFFIYMPKLSKDNYNKVRPPQLPMINYEPSKMYPINKSNIDRF
jgi:RHS repeat-associated protein